MHSVEESAWGIRFFPHLVSSTLGCAASEEVLELIVDSSNATLADRQGQTSLHVACGRTSFALPSLSLVRISAGALKMADDETCLPLHVHKVQRLPRD
jgi:hypothetical protein